MRQRQIDQFFKLLDQEFGCVAEVILVGASAASLMGHVRPSLDIDFEIRLKGPQAKVKSVRDHLIRSIQVAQRKVGVAVNYSEDISGWSMIHYLDYRKTATHYKQFGRIQVKLIGAKYWTIGKMARFLELDIRDMAKIIRVKKLKAGPLLTLWSRAANSSDLSLGLEQFRNHVIFFLKKYGKRLWGQSFNPSKAIQRFERNLNP